MSEIAQRFINQLTGEDKKADIETILASLIFDEKLIPGSMRTPELREISYEVMSALGYVPTTLPIESED